METDFQSIIVSNLRKILNKKNISQAELARQTEMDTATISKMFNGQVRMNVNALSEISTAIGVSVMDIITYPEQYVKAASPDAEPLEAVLQIRLKKDKKDQVMKLIFGEHCLEILNK